MIPTDLHRYFDITLVQPLILHLLDITPMMGVLNGVVMEISVRKINLIFLPEASIQCQDEFTPRFEVR